MPDQTNNFSEDEVLSFFVSTVDSAGGIRKFAASNNISAGHVCHVYHGEKDLTPRLLEVIGFEKTVSYKKRWR